MSGVEIPVPNVETEYVEKGTPRYRIHDLSILGSGYRSIQMGRDEYGRLLLVSGGNIWSFDGNNWSPLYEQISDLLPIVGLDSSDDSPLYVGGNGEWGYLVNGEDHRIQFVSCKNYKDPTHVSVQEDLFNVKNFGPVTGFMSNYSVVLLDEALQSKIYQGFYRLTTQFYFKDEVYVCSEREGVCRFRDGEIQSLEHLVFENAGFVTSSYSWDEDRVLLGTSNGDVYVFDGENTVLFEIDFPEIETHRINDLLIIENQFLAISLEGWGLLVVDLDGNYVNSINHETDQRFLNATALNYNKDGCLWVSVASGLAQVFFPSPLVIFDHSQGFVMSWPSVYRYNGKLVLRSNRTIFEGVYGESNLLTHFKKMNLPVGNRAVDAVLPLDEGVLFGDKTGIFYKKNDGSVQTVAEGLTTHYLRLHPENPNLLFSFNSSGIYLIRKSDEAWRYLGEFLEAPGANNQVFYTDKEGWFWTERGIGSVVRFKIENNQLVGRVFDEKDGLGNTWTSMYNIDGDVYVRATRWHMLYNYTSGSFEPSAEFNEIEREIGLTMTRPKKLSDTEYFLPTDNGLVLLTKKENGERVYDYSTFGTLAEYNPMILDTIEGEIWMRTQNTLIKYNPEIGRNETLPVRTYISRIEIPGKNEVLFALDATQESVGDETLSIDYNKSGVSIHYFSPSFDRIHPLKHRYFLEGFSSEWSDLSALTHTMFVGLSEGHYTFLVQAVDHLGHAGETTRLSILIHPPWYRTPIAYVSYFVALGVFIFLVTFFNRRSVVEENHRLESLVDERTSRLKEAANRAETATLAKSQFLANMSHEIRTPINGIIGSSELMASGHLEKEQAELLRMIQSSSSSLIGLVEGILDFSRIEANRIELSESRFDLEILIHECLHVVSNLSQKKRIELFYTLDPTITDEFWGDSNRIRQVIINLLSNAIKFTHEGHVRLVCEISNQEHSNCKLKFRVEDTGVGIDLDKSGDLFEPFHQVDNSNTRNHGGTGLGLAICKQLVSLMRGQITIESAPDQGTNIEFTMWVRQGGESSKKVEHSSEKIRFLLIDNLDVRRLSWRNFLETHGNVCLESSNVEHGLDILSLEGSIDYVLVEYRESPLYHDLSHKLLELKERKLIQGFQLFAYPDIKFSQDFRPYVKNKPYSYREIYLGLLGSIQGPFLPDTNLDHEREKESDSAQIVRLKGLKVLTVEDNRVNHRVISLILSRAGIETEQAWDGREAVELSLKNQYDAILMDVQMPVMDGLEATAIIKARANPPYIIGVTANVQEADRQQALESKMDDYLTKPIRRKDLMNALERSIDIQDKSS